MRKGYEVEYISHLPVDDAGEADFDCATYEHRDFSDIERARKFAKEVLPLAVCGAVQIRQFEDVPYEPGSYATHREYAEHSLEEIS